MIDDLVSVIMPSYNVENFIGRSIESVMAQTYGSWELLIVDDASPDNSNSVIEEYVQKDSRVKLFKLEQNSGQGVARNKAIEESQGQYIAFLDSDDIWLPNKLEKQIAFMKSSNAKLSFTSYQTIDEEDNLVGEFLIPQTKVNYKGLLKTCMIGNLTAIYDAGAIGKQYLKRVSREDYVLWLDILKIIDYAHGLPERLSQYRLMGQSYSSNKMRTARWQWTTYRDVEKIGFFQSIYYFIHYTHNGFTKYKNGKAIALHHQYETAANADSPKG